jgi:hypothetical protein
MGGNAFGELDLNKDKIIHRRGAEAAEKYRKNEFDHSFAVG